MLDSNFAAYAAATQDQNPTNTTEHPQTANAITTTDVEAIVAKFLQKNTGTKSNTNTTNNNSKHNSKVRIAQGFNADGDLISYCWSHGITKNLGHDSKTCRRKKEGHQDMATLNNRLNGSNEICEKRD